MLYRVYDRVKAFIVRAGTLIFCSSVLVWAAAYFPMDHAKERELQQKIAVLEEQSTESPELDSLRDQLHVESGRLLEASYLGRAGHWVEPLVKPLGWDWRIGVSVIASFPAREVVLATMGTIFSLGSEVADEGEEARFADALKSATWPDGRPCSRCRWLCRSWSSSRCVPSALPR